MSEALDDLDLTEDEQKELNNEAPTNEAETNEAETNETPQEAEAEDTNANVETNIDSDYENFKNRWAKKTPDEIIDGLWNQNKARREARKNEKDTKESLQAVLDKIEESKKARAEKLAEDKKMLEQNFQRDPIGATKAHQMQIMDNNEKQKAIEDQQKIIDWHTQKLYQERPDFSKHANDIVKWGLKKGYTQEELNSRYDWRDLANMYDLYMSQTQQNNSEPAITSDFDRAKQGNAPTTLSSVRGAKSGKNRSLKQRAAEIYEMEDSEFNKLGDDELDNILKSLDKA